MVESSDVEHGQCVMVRSSSGDIDIIVLFLLHQFDGIRVLVDNKTGKKEKIMDMTTSTLSSEYRQALAGVHAFSGH